MKKIVFIFISIFLISCSVNKQNNKNKIVEYFNQELNIIVDYIDYDESKSKDRYKYVILYLEDNKIVFLPSRFLELKGIVFYYRYKDRYFLIDETLDKLIKDNHFFNFEITGIQELNENDTEVIDNDAIVNEEIDVFHYDYLKGKTDLKKSMIYYYDKFLEISKKNK